METIEYKNLSWYVINETDKEKLLFLKDSFTSEQVLKYFTDKSMIFRDLYVQFSKINSPWFMDSYIRKVLNSSFLSDLNKNELNIMKTALTLNNETKISEDYVRLITKEEVEKLPKEVLKTERKYGYWTMSPYLFIGSYASVFGVNESSGPGALVNNYVYGTNAVRPVISLKSETINSDIFKTRNISEEDEEIRKAILKFRKRTSY